MVSTLEKEIDRRDFLRLSKFGAVSVVLWAVGIGRTVSRSSVDSDQEPFPEFVGPDQGFVTPHTSPKIGGVGFSLDFREEAQVSERAIIKQLRTGNNYMLPVYDNMTMAHLMRADVNVFDKLARKFSDLGLLSALDYEDWKRLLASASPAASMRWDQIEQGPQYYEIAEPLVFNAPVVITTPLSEVRARGVSNKDIIAVSHAQWNVRQPNNDGRVIGVRDNGEERMYYMDVQVGSVFPTAPESGSLDTRFCPKGARIGYWKNYGNVDDTEFVEIAKWT